jgi:hypothetical protein
MAERTFDFLVIGAQKCGTTSLWRGMESHPQIRVPSDKERGFFEIDERYESGVSQYVSTTFPGASDEERIGIVSPLLMAPNPARLAKVVERIHETCPEVRLVAVLRDPIQRAISYFRWATRRGATDGESIDQVARRRAAKHGGLENVPFVRAGMYGGILSEYLDRFPRERMLVLLSQDLSDEPRRVYEELFDFLGVDSSHDPGSPRINVGGTSPRVSEEAMAELVEELKRQVWPEVRDANVRRGFSWWLKQIWNVEPDDEALQMPAPLEQDLAELYLQDAAVLRERLGVQVPWEERLRSVGVEA